MSSMIHFPLLKLSLMFKEYSSSQNFHLDRYALKTYCQVLRQSESFFIQASSVFKESLLQIIKSPNPFTTHFIRSLFICCISYPLLVYSDFHRIIIDLVQYLMKCPTEVWSHLMDIFLSFPECLTQFINALQLTLDILATKSENPLYDEDVLLIVNLLHRMFLTVHDSGLDFNCSDFYNDVFSSRLKVSKDSIKLIRQYFSVVSVGFKYTVLNQARQQELAKTQAPQNNRRSMYDDENSKPTLKIEINRPTLVEESLRFFQNKSGQSLRSKPKIIFKGEPGVDAGGITREYFFLLTKALFSKKAGLFEPINTRSFWFQQHSTAPKDQFEALGKIVACALFNQILIPTRFPIVMYKKLFNYPLKLADYSEISPKEARSLQSLLQKKKNGEDISCCDMYFSTVFEMDGYDEEIDFIDNGRNILVTNENLEGYIHSFLDYHLNQSIKVQFEAFKKGFRSLIQGCAFRLLSPFEFDILVAGEEHYDWEAMKHAVKYIDGYNESDQTIKIFWEVFDELTEEQKKDFLFFTTGSSRAPIEGLGSLDLKIQRGGDRNLLPTAHTCFNSFTLPEYKDKNRMKRNLTTALENCQGFEIQ